MTSMGRPGGLNLLALRIRLTSTCPRRRPSARTSGGPAGAEFMIRRRCPRRRSKGETTWRTSATTSIRLRGCTCSVRRPSRSPAAQSRFSTSSWSHRARQWMPTTISRTCPEARASKSATSSSAEVARAIKGPRSSWATVEKTASPSPAMSAPCARRGQGRGRARPAQADLLGRRPCRPGGASAGAAAGAAPAAAESSSAALVGPHLSQSPSSAPFAPAAPHRASPAPPPEVRRYQASV